MARVVGLVGKHSPVRSTGAAVGSINKGKCRLSPCELALLFHIALSPRARSKAHRGRTLARQDTTWFP